MPGASSTMALGPCLHGDFYKARVLLILLPPSEGKAFEGGDGRIQDFNPELLVGVRAILKHERGLSERARIKFYGAKTTEKAETISKLNRAVLKAPCMPALERYTGVVYQHIDYAALKKKRAAQKRVQIVSGLFGLIAGGTRIPNYKMPMNAWLHRYWREENTKRLAKAKGRQIVLSLLPQAYAKAIDLGDAITVDFRVQGGKKSAGHFGKAIKGRFVRYLLENGVTDSKDFDGFREDGYRFDGHDFVQG